MKKNRTVVTALLLFMTVVLLGAIFYISTLLSSDTSPTQIQKTKASAVTYSRTVDLPDFGADNETEAITPEPGVSPLVSPPVAAPTSTQKETVIKIPPTEIPTKTPTLLAQAPTLVPTLIPTKVPTATPLPPTEIPEPTEPPTPTLSPLLAYKSTGGVTPTLIPIANTGGMNEPTKAALSPTKKVAPTGVQKLPDTGWIQTSSILFIVATSTILISLLF